MSSDGDKVPFSTERFIWIHTPKTGGQWLYRVITSNAPPSWNASYGEWCHIRLRELPHLIGPNRSHLPVISCVRNPWDWYVSVYFWMEQHYVNRTGAFALPQSQRDGMAHAWAPKISGGNSIAGFQQSLPRLIDYTEGRVQSDFLRNNSGNMGVVPVRFERLREEFIEALVSVGAEVTPNLRHQILKSPKYNTSVHAHFTKYYTNDLVDLVREKERWVIDTFGYEFQ